MFFFFSEGGLRKRWVRRWTTVQWFTSPRWMSVLCVSNCLSCSARRAECAQREGLHVQMRFTLQVWSLIYGDCGVAATRLPSVWFCPPSFCVALREVVKEGFFFFLGGFCVPYCCSGYSVAGQRLWKTFSLVPSMTCIRYFMEGHRQRVYIGSHVGCLTGHCAPEIDHKPDWCVASVRCDEVIPYFLL